MPTTTTQRATGSKPRRTLSQVQATCKQMAIERGVSIEIPRTLRDGYATIRALRAIPRSSYKERRDERHQIADDMATRRGDAAQVRPEETDGYGSGARWSSPELLATYQALDGSEHRLYGRRGEHGVRVMDRGPGPIRTADVKHVASGLHKLDDLRRHVHGWIRAHAIDPNTAEVADYLTATA